MVAAATILFLLPAAARGEGLDLARAERQWAAANHALRLARGAVAAAEADRVGAGQAPNPQFSYSANAINPRTGVGSGNFTDKRVDAVYRLEQVIERGDKRALRQREAEAALAAARQEFAAAAQQGRAQLHATYYELKYAEERQRIAAELRDLAAEALRAADARLAAGDIPRNDRARLEIELLRAEAEARAAQAETRRAALALALFMGAPARAESFSASDNWPALETPLPALPETGSRPETRAAQDRLAAAEARRELARALGTRDVTVGVQYERYPVSTDSPNNTYGISVSVPLFAWHRHEGEVARAEADIDAARSRLDLALAQAQSEGSRLVADLEAARQRRRRLEQELLPQAEAVAQAAEFAYRKGAMGLIDLIDARRSLRQARLDAAQARLEHARSHAAWVSLTSDPLTIVQP